MELSHLVKITKRSKKRVGRGYGSGKGKTAGRGTKGQKAHERVKTNFEGGQIPLPKRLPLLRGKGRNVSFKTSSIIVNIKLLNYLPKDSVVDKDALVNSGLVDKDKADKFGIKILGDGELKNPNTVKLPSSRRAIKKIEKAGGKVIL